MTNGDELSLVLEVKENQDQDPVSLELKANVHKQRVLAFEQGGDGVLRYQGRLCVSMMEFKRGSWRKLIAPDISFIRVPPRHTAILEKYIGAKV